MRWVRGITHRLRSLLGRTKAAQELDEEIRYHIELDVKKNIEAGMAPHEARRQALLRFGSIENAKEEVRDESGVRWIEDLLSDVRFALRGLRKTPVFTAAALISLGIGIGANTAIFSVVNGVLLQPLAYSEADELFITYIAWRDFNGPLSDADFLRLSEMQDDSASFAAYSLDDFTVARQEGPEIVRGARVTPTMFDLLGISPLVGRSFSANDEYAVLVSHDFWQTRLSGMPDVLDRSLEVNGDVYSIVGVLPSGFHLPRVTQSEIYMVNRVGEPPRRGPFYLRTIVRLPEGTEHARFHEHLGSVAARTKSLYPAGTDEWSYGVLPLKELVVGNADRMLYLLFAAVGCVLFIAIANVTNLLLARGSARRSELALRSALGANRSRLVRHMLTESAVLGVLGATLGVGLAWVGGEILGTAAASFLPRMDEVGLDNRVLAFALTVGFLSGLIVGVVPALSIPWKRVNQGLGATRRSGAIGSRRGVIRRVLVIAEFALALTVLLASGLLIRSLRRMQSADLGFEHENIIVFRLSLPSDPYESPEEFDTFLATLEQRLIGVPGVSRVGYATAVPPDRLGMTNNYTVEGQEPGPRGAQPVSPWLAANESYFGTLGIPLMQGRTFHETDRDGEPGAVIVNEAFARFHFPDESAVGKRLKDGAWDATRPWLTIVGVVGDAPYRGIRGGDHRTVYVAYRQSGRWRVPWVVVRHERHSDTVIPQMRREIVALDARIPMHDISTMQQLVRESTSTGRSLSALFLVLAVVAVVLAATGIYGVISYHVNMRRREIAIRQALGSANISVVGRFLKEGLGLAAFGVVLGSGGAYLLARGLRSLLYDISPTDVTTYVGTALILTATALLACVVPSVRASRVDPVTALREE